TQDRRLIIGVSQIVPIAASAVLWALTGTGAITVQIVYPLVALMGAAAAFEGPARASLLPLVVPRSSFQRAVAVATTVAQLTLVLGPAISGLIIARFGVAPAYLLHVVVLLLGVGFLLGISVSESDIVRPRLSLAMIREGFAFIWAHQ